MPVEGSKKIRLTVANVLDRVSAYDIYRYYVGHDFQFGKAFISPFRKENNPSFSINVNKTGNITHIDFADAERKGGCIDFVQQLYNVDCRKALEMIDRDFNLGIYYQKGNITSLRPIQPTKPKEQTLIQVVHRRFTKMDLDYWNLYGVSEAELKFHDVFSVKKVYLNRRLHPIPDDEPVFGYLFDDKWKIYRPLAKERINKFMGNVLNDRMSGIERIIDRYDKIVVTKSKKDEIVLSKFLPVVCSVQSESVVSINTANINLLIGRGREVYLNFDSDEVGVQSCKYYNQFGFKWVNCPVGHTKPNGSLIKDFADLARYYGLDKVIEHFTKKKII